MGSEMVVRTSSKEGICIRDSDLAVRDLVEVEKRCCR